MLRRGFEIREGFEEWVLKLNMRGFMGWMGEIDTGWRRDDVGRGGCGS